MAPAPPATASVLRKPRRGRDAVAGCLSMNEIAKHEESSYEGGPTTNLRLGPILNRQAGNQGKSLTFRVTTVAFRFSAVAAIRKSFPSTPSFAFFNPSNAAITLQDKEGLWFEIGMTRSQPTDRTQMRVAAAFWLGGPRVPAPQLLVHGDNAYCHPRPVGKLPLWP